MTTWIEEMDDSVVGSVPERHSKHNTFEVKIRPATHSEYQEIKDSIEGQSSVNHHTDGSINKESPPPLPLRRVPKSHRRSKHKKTVSSASHKKTRLSEKHRQRQDKITIADNDYVDIYDLLQHQPNANRYLRVLSPAPSIMSNSGYLTPVGRAAPPPPEDIPAYIDDTAVESASRGLIHRKNKSQTVYIKVVFMKLGEIRTREENFSAEIFVQARWRESLLDRTRSKEDYELTSSDTYWNPKLTVENAEENVREAVWHTVSFNSSGHAYICEKRKLKGTFSENMELAQYPFDTQSFTVTLTSGRMENEVELRKETNDVDDAVIANFVDQQEWNLHKETESISAVVTVTGRNKTYKHPKLAYSVKATRKASYFVWNIVLFMIFICSLIFTTFSVDYVLVQNRLQLSFILLLSNITFKKVVSDTLPKVSYLTQLDRYVISQTAIMVLVCIWHAIVFQIENPDNAKLADMIALISMGSIYVLTHIIFFCTWGATMCRKRKVKYLFF